MTEIRVWDVPLRLFHWTLVVLVAGSAVTGEFSARLGTSAARWHMLSGYAILALLIFRLCWGFVGGTYARFASFLRGPGTVLGYVGELTGKRPAATHPGHNPLGGWSVVVTLACLALQVGSGLFIADDDLGLEGPLAKFVTGQTADYLKSLHEFNFTVLLILIATHVAAIAYYLFAKRENLVKPMLTGNKRLPAGFERASGTGGNAALGASMLAIGAGAVWYVATQL